MEHIFLNKNNHENDIYTYEKVGLWLNTLLDTSFLGKEVIIEQLMGAEYSLEGVHEYLDIKFKPNHCGKFPYDTRVPVELLARQPNNNVVNMLLHVIDGYVSILDINNLDLTDFDGEFSLSDIVHRVDEEVMRTDLY